MRDRIQSFAQLNTDQIVGAFKWAKEHDRVLFMALLFSSIGMRLSEIVNLRWAFRLI
jgi:integrase